MKAHSQWVGIFSIVKLRLPSPLLRLLALLGVSLLFSACATVEPLPVVLKKSADISAPPAIPAKKILKRKVAIARFTNETKYGRGLFRDPNEEFLAKQATDILTTKLGTTDKFILLERTEADKIDRELLVKMTKDDFLGSFSDMKISADYVIIGSISEFGRKEVSDVGVFSRSKRQMATAKVNLRLVDVYTEQVIYAAEGEGEAFAEAGTVMGLGARTGYDSTLNDKAISAAISKIVDKVIATLLEKPWRSYILSFEGEKSVIISGGKSQGISSKDIFGVYKKGKRVRNPQTDMFIELPGELVSKIQVISTLGSDPTNEFSRCAIQEGQIPTKINELYVQELSD